MNTNNDAVALAITKLNSSLEKTSLKDLIRARTRRSIMLVDVSSSMNDTIRSGGTKVNAMRTVARELRESHPVPIVAFGGRICDIVDEIPNPAGGTPVHAAINFARTEGATHAVLITDGIADSEKYAFEAADAFGGPIDCFYIGNGNDRGASFCEELARRTGGTANLTDLGSPKQLAGKITLLLGEGQKQLGGGR